MAYKYCVTINTGKGFIKHEDLEHIEVFCYPGNVYAVTDSELGQSWLNRVGGIEKTKAEAQAIVDAKIIEAQADWNTWSDEVKTNLAKNHSPTNITIV
jgi:phosphoserine aminotransferase